MSSIETPQQALSELREYINKYIEKLSQAKLAKELGVSEALIRRIEKGELNLQPKHVDDLIVFLHHRPRPLIKKEKLIDFRRDLLHGISVISYLVDYVYQRRRRMTLPPSPDEPILLKDIGEIPSLLGKHYPHAFIGREQLVEDVRNKLSRPQYVLISNFGGTGKTAVATKVVENYLQHHEGKSVIWLHVGIGTLEEIQEALIEVLDPKRRKGDRLIKLLRDAHVGLIVLDDVWMENLVGLELPYDVSLLVTSRRIVSFDHQRITSVEPLDTLDDDAALKLLLGSTFNAEEIDLESATRLCQQLGNHPLALRIAGASMSRGGRTPDEIAANLPDYILNNEKVAERTLDALIKQSFEAPDIIVKKDQLESVFYSLSSLFSTTVPEVLLFHSMLPKNKNIETCLETLVALRLITRDRRRAIYSMHDLVYVSAFSGSLREIRERGLKACIKFTKVHAQNYDAVFSISSNVIGLIRAHFQDAELVPVTELYEFIWPLAEKGYFDARGYITEIVEGLRSAAQYAEQEGGFRAATYLWAKAGNGLTEYLINFDEAVFAYEEAGRLAKLMQETSQENESVQHEAQYRRALSYSLVGKVYVRAEKPQQAQDYFNRAIEIAQDPYNPKALSQIYEHLLFLAGSELNDMTLAREYAQLSLQHAEQIDDRKTQQERRFFVMMNIGQIERAEAETTRQNGESLQNKQKLQAVLELYDEAGVIADEQNNDDWKGRVEQERGEVYLEMEECEKAAKHLKEAERLFREIISPRLEDVTKLLQRMKEKCS